MLTPGNRTLGHGLIWGFTLPSGTAGTCPGRTSTCEKHCYALRLERLRPQLRRAAERNLELSRNEDFAPRMRHFILAHAVRVVRQHIGGDFYSAAYAHKWLWVMRKLPRTRFFFYTRSWRAPAIAPVLEEMARLENCCVWYSCDRDTGLPESLPSGVRVAWLHSLEGEPLPPTVDLVFRRHGLRKKPSIGLSQVCPEQDGVPRAEFVTCLRCQRCFRPEHTGQHGGFPRLKSLDYVEVT